MSLPRTSTLLPKRCTANSKDMRSSLDVMSNGLHGVKRRTKRRSRRAGVKVRARRQAALAREAEATSAHIPACEGVEAPASVEICKDPEVITISDDSDSETIVIPPPPPTIEIIDTDTALKVQNHFDIPDNVLISFVRNFSNGTPEEVPPEIGQWCHFVFETQ
ncbi:hypothetical protein ANTPLA_LOCUS7703 [Anthophora plagiata]